MSQGCSSVCTYCSSVCTKPLFSGWLAGNLRQYDSGQGRPVELLTMDHGRLDPERVFNLQDGETRWPLGVGVTTGGIHQGPCQGLLLC